MKEKTTSVRSGSLLDTKRKFVTACIAGAVILILVFVLMLFENNGTKLIIKNNTDLKLETLKGYFVNESGMVGNSVELQDISKKQTKSAAIESMNLYKTDSNYEIHFKFENSKEILVDAGLFNDEFKGTITVTFKKTSDPNVVKMNVKASNGLLSSKLITCNDKYTVDLSNGTSVQ